MAVATTTWLICSSQISRWPVSTDWKSVTRLTGQRVPTEGEAVSRRDRKSAPVWRVVLRRRNGRVVKEWERTSKYAAKNLKASVEEDHDDSYYVEVVPPK